MTGVSALTAFSSVIIGGIGVVVILIGGRDILAGTMSVGDLLAYIMFTGLLAVPIVQMASIGTQISEAFAGLDRIQEILNTPREDAEDASRTALEDLRGDIEFQDVWFEYNPGMPVLKNVNFKAKAGTTTALVGSSGSGKSTLISLVMAFNRPTQGRVLADDRDLTDLRLAEYRRHLGVVLQDNFLFDGTVADNIKYGSPAATRADVQRVAKIANADEFIGKFEKGYDTIVGERGVRLSGGQRQRVAIARAILADPRILLLDEATASLDSESEMMIQDGLRSLRRGRTTFVIAHRLSTIRSGRSDSGHRGRRDRRTRHARGIARACRTLPAALRQAVQLRARPIHQSRRGFHARGAESCSGGQNCKGYIGPKVQGSKVQGSKVRGPAVM
jgi:subfamily B ATP-binding cassette protein MsbA